MHRESDVCIVVEGGYPYSIGGVATWLDSFLRSFPHMQFHIVTIRVSTTGRTPKYPRPDNVVDITDINIDQCPAGRAPTRADRPAILSFAAQMQRLLSDPDPSVFAQLMLDMQRSGLGRVALLDTRAAWQGMERAYNAIAPNAPLVDFFWTWRNFATCIIALASAPLPRAKSYHALATGYSGLFGARAKALTQRPFVITEHGIYTNERRIELAVADWLYVSGAGGYDVSQATPELHDLWLDAFRNFSAIAYGACDVVTTQYRDNQSFQRNDGAPAHKQRLIPNGIDVDKLRKIQSSNEPRRPTIALLGRVVPIKDTRTFILAAGAVRKAIPDVEALIIGPEDEDPIYAADCHSLVRHENLEGTVRFLGRVPELAAFFSRIDILVITSISEAQPLVLLEAGAAGLPAVTSDVGSCREIIEGLPEDGVEGAGGVVVPASDPKATADALIFMLRDAPLRARMADAMRRRVESYYSKPRIDRLYSELYASLFETRA